MSGRRKRTMLLDSMITFSAPAILRWMSGMASLRRPWRVRTQMERSAPATRKREVSVSPERSRSSLRARKWSSPVSQSQGLPSAEQIPWPNCVILSAVQWYSGRAAIRPATTLVLPTLRECPPMTTRAIHVYCGRFGGRSQQIWLLADSSHLAATDEWHSIDQQFRAAQAAGEDDH